MTATIGRKERAKGLLALTPLPLLTAIRTGRVYVSLYWILSLSLSLVVLGHACTLGQARKREWDIVRSSSAKQLRRFACFSYRLPFVSFLSLALVRRVSHLLWTSLASHEVVFANFRLRNS